ncbi:MAG: hypothetical protein HDT48_07200 [Ruminococcaceae bacterium]|nr:hypothetical protein [Oscillospiraceae bacterium]
MDKFLKFIKNRWFLLGISFLSFIYVFFLGKVVLLTFTSYPEIENVTTLMIMYVFINFLFAVLMFFTRKQVPTVITAAIIPLEAFLLMIVGFGQWHVIIPPVAVSAFIFLACGVGESFKTVVGTLYLMMFIVGGLVYSVFLNFGISVSYVLVDQIYEEDQELDYSQRSHDYLTTSDGKYRLVHYVDSSDSGTVTNYYVEEAFRDEEYPFVTYRRVFGCRKVLAIAYENANPAPRWVSDGILYIDGKTVDMEELFAPPAEEEEETEETTTKAPPARITVTETPAPDIITEETEEPAV